MFFSCKLLTRAFFCAVAGMFFATKSTGKAAARKFEFDMIGKLEVNYPDSAYNILKNWLNAAKDSKNEVQEAFCLEYMGQILYHTGNFANALENLQAALKIFRDKKELTPLAQTLNSLGNVYASNSQASIAFSMHKEALDLYLKMADHVGTTETYGQLGFFYEKHKKKDSAFYYQRLALAEPVNPADSLVKAKIYENLGSLLEDEERFDTALICFQQALRLNRKFQNSSSQIEILNNLGDIYRKTGDKEKGLFYTRQAAVLAGQLRDRYQLQSAYWDLARTFKMLHQLDSALYYTEESKSLQHQIYTAESSKQLAITRTLFDMERKNAEINQLNASHRIHTAIITAVILIAVLLVLLTAIILNRQSLKIKNERILNENRQKILEAKHALAEADLRAKELEETSLQNQLELKTKSLSSHILHLIQKNEVLETLRAELTQLVNEDKRDQKKQLRGILQKINISFSQDSYWEEFRYIFDQVHKPFFDNVQKLSAELSVTELRLLSLIKMDLNPQEISSLLGITADSVRVTKYRIKKKLNIPANESLTTFIQEL